MHAAFFALYLRDLRLALRRRIEALLPMAFIIIAVSLFPLGVGPEPRMLREMAPGVVWVCALLASMLSVSGLYAGDFTDGSLEQMLLSGHSGIVIACAKVAAHWTLTGLPLIVTAPVIGLMLGMSLPSLLVLSTTLLLGTPILSLLGSVGAALTLGLRSAGVLIILLVLPLSLPVLIFGAGAISAAEAGQSPSGHYSILGALLIFAALTAPPATSAALRISLE
ncbi:heme exporter protein CcmB [Burkholderia singularis]|uniref:Heme exporter protein B n=1 Tax=Burkholderia singularis TaxID=1503053 RepID=A0A238H4Y8_9BURK|nr:heme exporter protein CcmB [Burkholderia singularis]SMG00235.1 ABC transporter involved in cytochrome c biogenesis, CcmB subunit [Burkholderia singularis]